MGKCEKCGGEIKGHKDKRFCSDAHRKAFSRTVSRTDLGVTRTEIGVTRTKSPESGQSFIPNWQRQGFKSREEGMANVLKRLFKDKDRILKHSISKEAVFYLGDRKILEK